MEPRDLREAGHFVEREYVFGGQGTYYGDGWVVRVGRRAGGVGAVDEESTARAAEVVDEDLTPNRVQFP